MRTRRWLLAAGRTLLALGLLGYVASLLVQQWDEARATLPVPSVGWLAASACAMCCYYALMLANWRALLRALKVELGWREGYRIRASTPPRRP
jgi:uncharacterized membrane protein YbhN (UPF0104 family)